MSEIITLTLEEVREARDEPEGCEEFLGFGSPCEEGDPPLDAYCRLCKKLTLFASGEDDKQ